MKFLHQTIKQGYVVKVHEVDQYWSERSTLYKSELFPTREAAKEHLAAITRPHPHVPGRLIWNDAPHSYHTCDVQSDMELISEEWK